MGAIKLRKYQTSVITMICVVVVVCVCEHCSHAQFDLIQNNFNKTIFFNLMKTILKFVLILRKLNKS